MKTLDEQIAIMTAYKNGATIESTFRGRLVEWHTCTATIIWDWANFDFRVAEPVRKAHVVYLIGGENGTGWRFAQSAAELAVAVPFHAVLPAPPLADLIRVVLRVVGSGYGPEIQIAGSSVPAGRKLVIGERIDFVEVPK